MINDQAEIVKEDMGADNGLIHEIDQVIDPLLVNSGGPSKRTTAPTREKTNLTIAEFLRDSPRLTNSSRIINVNSPDMLRRLSKRYGSKQFFVVPQNEACDLMPTILPVYRKCHTNLLQPSTHSVIFKSW